MFCHWYSNFFSCGSICRVLNKDISVQSHLVSAGRSKYLLVLLNVRIYALGSRHSDCFLHLGYCEPTNGKLSCISSSSTLLRHCYIPHFSGLNHFVILNTIWLTSWILYIYLDPTQFLCFRDLKLLILPGCFELVEISHVDIVLVSHEIMLETSSRFCIFLRSMFDKVLSCRYLSTEASLMQIKIETVNSVPSHSENILHIFTSIFNLVISFLFQQSQWMQNLLTS